MTVERGNWSMRDPESEIADNETINGGNFMQAVPDTPIMVGKPLTISGGNWINVRQDAAWTVTGGTWSQIDRCAHLHPEWGLPAEVDNCRHVIEMDTVTIDGVAVATVYHREDQPG